ncbi:isoprenylcysteine carboxylmethyltransferase family protein [Fabibacter sp. E12]|nr:isoprenylcysteine carboxylmethyltransferase family protein [Roseivirga sp. E12]
MWLDHSILFLGWGVFYFLHSFLLLPKVKERIGLKPRTYRILYNLISLLVIGLVLLISAIIPSPLLMVPTPTHFYVGLMMATMGIFIIKRAFRAYSTGVFLGFKPEPKEQHLATDGLQRKVRHPLYSGTILIFLGYFTYNPLLSSFVTLLALVIYLPIGIRLEEKKLIQKFGQAYIEYKKEVPAIFPTLFKRSSSQL